MERLVNSRLTWFLERNILLSDVQSGHRTVEDVTCLEADIKNAVNTKEYLLKAVFLDIEKVYDMVRRKGIRVMMHYLGIGVEKFAWVSINR